MHALQVLDFQSVLARLAEHCQSELGRARASELEPQFEPDEINRMIGETRDAFDLSGKEPLPTLNRLYDVVDGVQRAGKGSVLDGLQLYRVGASLSTMRQLAVAMANCEDSLKRLSDQLPSLNDLEARLTGSLDVDGEMLDEASPDLARARRTKRSTAVRLTERIQSYTSGRTRELLSDPIVTQRQGRYVVPVKAEHRGKIKGFVHDTSATGQTLYIEPEDVAQLGNSLREAEALERAEIERILRDLSERVGAKASEIIVGLGAAGELDLIFAKVRHGVANDGAIPEIGEPGTIRIERGKHPLLDPKIAIPLDIELGENFACLLITGPNTGGKTVAMKTVGLFVAMVQSGLMPNARRIVCGPFSQIWADIGDEQSMQQSLSTFSGHLKNIVAAVKGIKPNGLVLLDEIGAGTDPAEGAALGKAILVTLRDLGAKVIASTHYGELKVFAFSEDGFANAAMEFDAKSLGPTYRFLMGAPGASHALKIAERYGMPRRILESAEGFAGDTHLDLNKMMERLEVAQKQAHRSQSEADKLAHQLRELERETEKRLAQAEAARKSARQMAAQTLEEALREVRLEAQDAIEALKKGAKVEDVRERLKKVQSKGEQHLHKLQDRAKTVSSPVELRKGMSVKALGHTAVGTLLEDPKDGKARVSMGPLTLTIETKKLLPVTERPVAVKRETRTSHSLKRASTISREIVMIRMRAEEASETLTRFLDDAVLAGVEHVRIVHGKGEGILRKVTQDVLRAYPAVKRHREGEPAEGGSGVTIAYFE